MADLEIEVIDAPPAEAAVPLLAVPLFEGERALDPAVAELDRRLGGSVARVLERGDFRGRKTDALVLYPRADEIGAERVLLVGLGKRADFAAEPLRRAAGLAARQTQQLGVAGLTVLVPAPGARPAAPEARWIGQALAEGAVLASWDFRELKTGAADEAPRAEITSLALLAVEAGEAAELGAGARQGAAAARGENLARELAERPGNIATPTFLAEAADSIARAAGLELTVLDRAALRAERMGALLAVAQGSDEEPRFIILEYRGGAPDDAPLALVGKGITFDSGGISIKPAQNMEEMKYDMSGGAAVLGALSAIAELRLGINVVGLVPATENLPSGHALKPGDVIRAHSGRTIEVINTDAEGRLVLADALSYAGRFKPRAMLDAATLTGACVVALGHHAIGLMGNDDALVAEVRQAGERAGERCWPLPLWDEYRQQLDSAVADLKNSGGRPAGTLTAGWFLKEFVPDGVPWAHLDTAGTAYRDEAPPHLRKGATGMPTRLFVEWVRARADAS